MFRNAAKAEARDNREGDERKWMQLFRDLGAGSKSEVFALKAGVAQNLEDRRDGLVNIVREREVLGWRISGVFATLLDAAGADAVWPELSRDATVMQIAAAPK